MSANDRQVGGSHYKTGGEEHWDRVARLGLDYFQGQITKYVERWKKKNGLQDLHKARHFLDKYIELETANEQKAKQELGHLLVTEAHKKSMGQPSMFSEEDECSCECHRGGSILHVTACCSKMVQEPGEPGRSYVDQDRRPS